MNEIQEKTYQLLREVKDICESKKITYFLGPFTLSLAVLYGGHSEDSINLDVLIPAQQMMKFIDEVRHRRQTDRALDYMGNYYEHGDFCAEYVDKTTTFIQWKEGTNYSCYGVKIQIVPLRKPILDKKENLQNLVSGWLDNNYKIVDQEIINGKNAAFVRDLRTSKSNGNTWSKGLFQRFMRASSTSRKDVDQIILTRKNGQESQFSETYFQEQTQLLFEQESFAVPAHYKAFLEEYYGKKWKNRRAKKNIQYNGCVISSETPYETYVNACSQNGLDLRAYFAERKALEMEEIQVEQTMTITDQAMLLAKRSGDRLHLFETLQKQRTQILAMYEEKNYDALHEIFAEYLQKVQFYLKLDLGFCVNREYHEIFCDLMRHKGREKMIAKLEELIPEEHFKSIISV